MNRSRILSFLKYLLFLCGAALLLWYVTREQDLRLLRSEIAGANYFWVGLSLVISLFSHLFRAARWHLLIETLGYRPGLKKTFYATMTGYFANLFVPRLGEVMRCGALSRSSRIPVQHLFGTIVAERGFDLLTLAVIIVLTVTLQLDVLGAFVSRNVISPVAEKLPGSLLYIGIAVAAAPFLFFAFRHWMKRLSRSRKGAAAFFRFRRLLAGFLAGMKTVVRMRRRTWFLVHTLLIWLCYFLMVYVCFFSLGATSSLGIPEGLTVLSLGSLGIVAPFPGGVGSYHLIVKIILTDLYNVATASALSYAYIVHTSQFALVLVVGLITTWLLLAPGRIKRSA